ncbi:ribokinase [Spelaeicoccus albus]|uniref:Ribokinase n=1 Tax=Spelaeicoccus albus TaxID=1280376 RepID=A0A7Z0D0D0_9MICO|nr:ribokinase [Spelaeicoccus albus]NYI67209.1 ribokinase [Spelaeicoccus albus]
MTDAPRTGDVIVLGSINVDHSIYVDAFPEPGETILARAGAKGLGGKGANQSAAASLLGATVHLLGRVGDDEAAGFIRSRLEHFGIDAGELAVSADNSSGAAYITVESSGENTVAVVSGANADVDIESLTRAVDGVIGRLPSGAADVVGLAQGETPARMTAAFARRCRTAGVRFVVNLAPAIELDRATIALADPLIVNEGEARAVHGRLGSGPIAVETTDDALTAARRMLADGLAESIVITLGADGAVVARRADGAEPGDAVDAWHEPSPAPAGVVDTTGAGDAFVGALVALLSGGTDLKDAVRWAAAAGSAAVTKKGTTDSYPDREALAELRSAGSAGAGPTKPRG